MQIKFKTANMGNKKKKRHHSNNAHLILPKLDAEDCECEPCPCPEEKEECCPEEKDDNEMDPEKMVSEIGSFKGEETIPALIESAKKSSQEEELDDFLK